jgi:hypothetical protein
MLGRQTVVDRHHQRTRADRVAAGIPVVTVQITNDPPAAVEEHHHRHHCVPGVRWPVQPDRDPTRGPIDRPVLDSQVLMNRTAGEIPEALPRGVRASVGRQLEWHRFQYLLQNGIQTGLVVGVIGDGHRLTVRIACGADAVGRGGGRWRGLRGVSSRHGAAITRW